MSQTTEMDPTLTALAASLGGRLVRPGDADWDASRAPHLTPAPIRA